MGTGGGWGRELHHRPQTGRGPACSLRACGLATPGQMRERVVCILGQTLHFPSLTPFSILTTVLPPQTENSFHHCSRESMSVSSWWAKASLRKEDASPGFGLTLGHTWTPMRGRNGAVSACVGTCSVTSVVSSSFAATWTVAHQVPLSTGFSRQEYWPGLPCPPPGDLPNPGIEPRSPT